jgi:hypothetical protein
MAKEKSIDDVRDGLPKTTSPIRAIRLKCLDCTCGSQKEVEACPIEKCPLWRFRFGKNPFRKPVSEENKAKAAERMRKYMASKKSEAQDV